MSPQQTIFSKGAAESGYRLQYLQVYNWGTFGENRVWTLQPEGQTSLLTGTNGSGKTTLVDALLTLLVPTRLRFYNQSSGTETRRDRTEASYVRGAFGQTQEEGRLGATTQYLRSAEGVYSVILACFYNEGLQQYLSIGQIRWFSPGGKLNQEFFSANSALDILDNEIRYNPGRNWKEKLRKNYNIDFHKSFSQYQAYFMRAFGMRSEKALNLFNQTIGIKVLGKLDDFIREQMIEPGNPEEEFSQLVSSFETLLSSYRAFEMARKQLALLEPVVEANGVWSTLSDQYSALEANREGLPIWFAQRHATMLRTGISQHTQELTICREKLADLAERIEAGNEEKARLMASIEGDETGRRIKALQKDLRTLEKDLNRAKAAHARYNKLAAALSLKENPNEAEFLENLRKTTSLQAANEQLKDELSEARIEGEIKLRKLLDQQTALETELTSLSERKNQIPSHNITLRAKILEAVGASEKEIPFIGELLQVRKEEAEVWEGAIERILHNFALRLLVPDALYAKVNQFVNGNRLNGRVVYHRVPKGSDGFLFTHTEPDALYSKLAIYPKTPYANWLENQIRRRYDHFCTEDLKEFRQYDKALTPSGLSKEKDRHEKDDRAHRMGRANYVLGWDNQDKIRLLKQQLRELKQAIETHTRLLKSLKKELKAAEHQGENLRDFSKLTSFQEIDWQAISVQIAELEKRLTTLQETSNQLKELEQQLKEQNKRLGQMDQQRSEALRQETRLEDAMDKWKHLLGEKETLLKAAGEFPVTIKEALDKRFSDFSQELNLDTIDKYEQITFDRFGQEREKLQSQLSHAESKLRQAMHGFKNPPEEVRENFRSWMGETQDLSLEREGVSEYLSIYERIKSEKLLTYERRFREYLDEKMVGDMGNFQTALDNRLELIKEGIYELNHSLKKIDFRKNPRTYIQLVIRPQTRPEIRDFQQRLKSDWKFDTGEYERTKDMQLLEQSFLKIKGIIEELKSDENRRKRLLDVRNWLVFRATEHFQETDEQYMVYESTGHLSGGEKAQITYTILGAALAYQFGIDRGGFQDKSFRFIVVDEAFSKLDPEKSRYLMDLCAQLHLQLLVVTPLDKIHVAEPYIHACHYVEAKEKRHSRIYNLTMQEYQERKEGFSVSG